METFIFLDHVFRLMHALFDVLFGSIRAVYLLGCWASSLEQSDLLLLWLGKLLMAPEP